MFVVLLGALLAQPTPQAADAVTPEPSASVSAPLLVPGGVRGRMPGREPAATVPPVAAEDVVIRNSGSTNSAGYTIVVHPDASADVYSEGTAAHATVGAPQAKWLFAHVRAAQPLDEMASQHCMKSVSFGTTTTVAQNGHVSPDLSCGGGPDARELLRTIGVVVNEAGVRTGPGRFRRRLL